MRNLIVYLVLSSLFLSPLMTMAQQAQELDGAESVLSAPKSKTKGIQVEAKGVKGFAGTGGTLDSNYEVSLGYVLGQTWQTQIVLGRLSKSRSSSGGDLKEWQYVEEESKLHSEYKMLEIKKLFFDPYSDRHIQGFFTTAGYGMMDAKVDYNYNRYKPDNGFICLIGPCERAVEESDFASKNTQVSFARVGAGYTYELRSPRSLGVVTISAAVNFNEYFKKDLVSLVGANHQGSFDLKDLDKTTAQLALGVMF